MRVTSSLWVGAYVRRCFAEGAFAAVVRRGAEEAGAIFVIVDRLNGTADLYAPAPQAIFDESRPSDRLFQLVAADEPLADVNARVEREVRFDPDLWVVAVEDRDGRAFLERLSGRCASGALRLSSRSAPLDARRCRRTRAAAPVGVLGQIRLVAGLALVPRRCARPRTASPPSSGPCRQRGR